MKSKLLTLTLLLVFGGELFAQNAAQTERMERRAARKARQAAELAQSRAEMIKLVKDTTFVIEANTFIGPFGQESPVSSFQNYFAIIGDKVAISVAFNNTPASQMSPLAWYGPDSQDGTGSRGIHQTLRQHWFLICLTCQILMDLLL